MSQKILLGAAAALLAACAALLGCDTRGAQPAPSEAVELRTYTVSPDQQDDVQSMLRYAVGGDPPVGRVAKGPAGTLLVVAPPGVHAGIESFIEELKGLDSPPRPSSVSLTYWFLVGRPIDASRLPAGASRKYTVAGVRAPARLEPALEQIAAVEGATEFSLLEQFQLSSVGHERTQARGRFARIEQRATTTGRNVVAEFQIHILENSFTSQVMLEPDQLLVLGQSGYAGKPGHAFSDAGPGEAPDLTLYYVMAADL